MLPRAIKMNPAWIRLRERGQSLIRRTQAAVGLSPVQAVYRAIERQGFPLATARTLEVFGGDGSLHTRYYARRVGSLEVWEYDARLSEALHRNLPGATIKIVDSYEEIDRTTTRFDFVWIDNPEMMHGPHCEHFDMLPRAFRILANQAVIVLVIIPRLDAAIERRFPYLWEPAFNDIDAHLARRARFYGTATPARISWREMRATYSRIAAQHGFEVVWARVQPVSFFSYLSLGVRKRDTA